VEIPRSKLYAKTQELLRNRQLSMSCIHEETGLPERWLWETMRNDDGTLGVNRVELLYEYLSGRTLEV